MKTAGTTKFDIWPQPRQLGTVWKPRNTQARLWHATGVQLTVLFLLTATVCVSGCRHQTDPRTQFNEGKRIASIQFHGNTALSDDQLRKYLPVQRKDTYLETNEAAVFDVLLQAYAAHGYYDAQIVKVDVQPTLRDWVRITVHLLEGRPTRVRVLGAKWRPPIPDSPRIMKKLPLKTGDIADIKKLNQLVKRVKKRLATRGYALADVQESMVVTRDEYAADIMLEIKPGQVCTIDKIHIDGLVLAPSDLVYRQVTEFEGEVYTPRVEKQIEDNLEQLNAFRMIDVAPVPRPDTPGVIDVDISVVEANFQNLKVGLGGQFETNKFLGWTSAVYQHNNFLHRLNQFQLRSKVGWALVPALWDVQDMGPVTLIEPSVTRRGFLEKKLVWNIATGLRTDVEENYKLFSPSARLSVSRPFFERLVLRLTYNFEYIVLYGMNDYIIKQLQNTYEDMRSPIRLADLNANVLLWLTDKQDNPNNGVIVQFDYWHSDPYLASQVAFNKIQPAVSAYWRVLPFFQIALHGELGFIYPIGKKDYTGIRANFFLGGHNTVRGWGGKRLAPWRELCVDAAQQKNCEKIWIGGKTMLEGNAEFRFRVSKLISVITFLDMGDVQYGVQQFVPSVWNYSAGGGIRIHTPVGRIRLDVGYRLNDPPLYRDEPRFGVHLGLGEAF